MSVVDPLELSSRERASESWIGKKGVRISHLTCQEIGAYLLNNCRTFCDGKRERCKQAHLAARPLLTSCKLADVTFGVVCDIKRAGARGRDASIMGARKRVVRRTALTSCQIGKLRPRLIVSRISSRYNFITSSLHN